MTYWMCSKYFCWGCKLILPEVSCHYHLLPYAPHSHHQHPPCKRCCSLAPRKRNYNLKYPESAKLNQRPNHQMVLFSLVLTAWLVLKLFFLCGCNAFHVSLDGLSIGTTKSVINLPNGDLVALDFCRMNFLLTAAWVAPCCSPVTVMFLSFILSTSH